MKPSEILQELAINHLADVPTMLHGAPGVGKSDVVRQHAKAMGVRLIDFRASLRDPVDLMGIPSVIASGTSAVPGMTVYNPPGELPRDGDGILFLDELNAAKPDTQAALYQLTLDRQIGSYTLPPGWRIVAAGNRKNDRGVVYAMPSPLRSRFAHLDYEVDVRDWCAWAAGNGVRVEVIAFVRFRPDALHAFDPKSDDHTFACPRTWHFASKILDAQDQAGKAPSIERFRSILGAGAGTEFCGFLSVFRSMPSIDAILMAPDKIDVPQGEPSVLFAIATALARRSNEQNFDRVATYLNRMPSEYAAYCIHDVVVAQPRLQSHPGFTLWASKHGALI